MSPMRVPLVPKKVLHICQVLSTPMTIPRVPEERAGTRALGGVPGVPRSPPGLDAAAPAR